MNVTRCRDDITEASLGQGRSRLYSSHIIVGIVGDAWMVAPGLVSQRGNRIHRDGIRQPVFSRALNVEPFHSRLIAWSTAERLRYLNPSTRVFRCDRSAGTRSAAGARPWLA